MYCAPLNVDLFFKKIFSGPYLAQCFLEDFLGIKITELSVLRTRYKFSDDAVMVKFDYRCKINGQYVIIEMQQQYKKDVAKRFYLYHCINTSVQLETLKPVTITKHNGETYKEKDYGGIEPVYTIVWMADDTLGFDEDFIVFTTLPEATKDFLTDETLWSQPLETIKKARSKTLKILKNKTKGLDFMQENKLFYFFQPNIVKNKIIKSYTKWCVLGKKSRNPDNVKSDFEEFKNDKVMTEVIRRLEKDELEPFEFDYALHYALHEHYWEEERREFYQEAAKEKEQAAKEKEQAAKEKEQAAKERQIMLFNAVHGFMALGKDIPYIAGILSLSVEEVNSFAQQTPPQ